MFRRILAVFIVALLIVPMVPFSASVAGASTDLSQIATYLGDSGATIEMQESGLAEVTLELSTETACPGDSVTASGTADADNWVSIKVIDEAENVVFFDAVKSDADGNYSLTFRVPYVSPGSLTVVAGYGTNVDAKELIVAEPAVTKDIASIAELADINVAYGTAKDNIGLPSQVAVTLDDNITIINIEVSWACADYDGEKSGEYTFTGSLINLPEGVSNSRNLTATVKVIVAEPLGTEVTMELSTETACPGDSVTASGTADADNWVSIKVIDEAENVVFFDAVKSGADGNYSLTFRVPYVSPGSLTVVAGYGTNVDTKELIVAEPAVTKDIASIAELADINVAYGTAKDNIGLPSQVAVTLDDNITIINVEVSWACADYDGEKSGEYTFTGSLINLPEGVSNSRNLTATVKVIVKPKKTSGGGGGGSAPADGTEIKIDKGGKISEHGAVVEIPAGAFTQDLKVKITKVTDVSGLTLPKGGQLVSNVVDIIKDGKGDFTKPVTVTMTFDSSKVDSKAKVTLCWYDPSGKAWTELDNIKVDWDKATVSGEIKHFTKFAVIALTPEKEPPAQVILTDITGHWAEADIKALIEKGAITGYPDQTFKPDNKITRAEFATVLVKAFQLESKTGKVFNDTAGHWAKEAIATAAAHGIVNGYSDTTFGPNDNITREQMAVMIVRAAQLAETTDIPAYNDSDKIADWAQRAVATASGSGIITGYPDNTFRPQGQATRAEASTVIVKALKIVSASI